MKNKILTNFKKFTPILSRLKSVNLLIVIAILILIVVINNLIEIYNANKQFRYGVSFSPDYTESFGLDWHQVYTAVLDDLKVRWLRLPTYWEDGEPNPNQFDFTQSDYLLQQAGLRQAKVLLVVGEKQPRWPECHIPKWAQSLSVDKRQQELLEYIQVVVQRYKNNPSIWAWQVENEPLFQFGQNCDAPDANFLQKEINLVKSIDPTRPVVITDTGEWSFWTQATQMSDIFGISLYRGSWNQYLGYFPYPFTASMYRVKYFLVQHIFAPNNKTAIVSELQAEPWLEQSLEEEPLANQVNRYPATNIQKNVQFAQKAGFDAIYLWGVEWWYYAKQNDYPQYWDYARTLFHGK